MDAVEFFEEWKRMCDSHASCHACGIYKELRNRSAIGCETAVKRNVREAVQIVEQWSKAHPIKTNADKFKEVFGTEPSLAGYQQNHTKAAGMPVDWWDKPYEAPKEDA